MLSVPTNCRLSTHLTPTCFVIGVSPVLKLRIGERSLAPNLAAAIHASAFGFRRLLPDDEGHAGGCWPADRGLAAPRAAAHCGDSGTVIEEEASAPDRRAATASRTESEAPGLAFILTGHM